MKNDNIKEDWIKNCHDLNRNKYNNNIVLHLFTYQIPIFFTPLDI